MLSHLNNTTNGNEKQPNFEFNKIIYILLYINIPTTETLICRKLFFGKFLKSRYPAHIYFRLNQKLLRLKIFANFYNRKK
ncbi:hypothetical protein BpHYR1_007611 [Brachionus plicatilis]|uniref:Uncharacterized protein n=1 Tax=Brachionus plicatilis TaxID=10195 RepID=A0A3M7QT38_BRAPC|nr:hypothetical protein BpHYR1_007611 [Brachionus plicatilis]